MSHIHTYIYIRLYKCTQAFEYKHGYILNWGRISIQVFLSAWNLAQMEQRHAVSQNPHKYTRVCGYISCYRSHTHTHTKRRQHLVAYWYICLCHIGYYPCVAVWQMFCAVKCLALRDLCVQQWASGARSVFKRLWGYL